jgi:hypothetical protein
VILIGNQGGGARDLAQHLLKEENDHVRLHELRGFVARDLNGALTEAYAVSRGTRCKQFLFSLSLNPPPDKNVPIDDFEAAIERVEAKLGLTGQPRAIVFHEKEGRRHAHAVWSRIDTEDMKAVQLSHSKLKLMDVSRELHIEHDWKMPRGLVERSERDPRNFTLEEWQQAKRNDVDPRDIKTHIQDAWAMSDSKTALHHALEERGYRLARGDKRGYVVIDYRGEPYSLPKYASVKTKDVRMRIGEPADLPSVDEAKAAWASDLLKKAQDLQMELDQRRKAERTALAEKRAGLVTEQRAERAGQDKAFKARQEAAAQVRQERFRPGFKGLWDRLRGEHGRIEELNLKEAAEAATRERSERDRLVFQHLNQRRDIVKAQAPERERYREVSRELKSDREKFAAAAQSQTPEPDKSPEPRKPARAPPRKEPPSAAPEFERKASPQSEPRPEMSEREKRLEAFRERRSNDAPGRRRDRDPSFER